MCWVALAITVGTSLIEASVQSNAAKQQYAVQKQQHIMDMENERIKALAETNNRMEAFIRQEAANRAALSASGLQQNISYEQGIAPYNREVLSRDVATISYNRDVALGQSRYAISVAKQTRDAAIGSAWLNAGIKVAGVAAQASLGTGSGGTIPTTGISTGPRPLWAT